MHSMQTQIQRCPTYIPNVLHIKDSFGEEKDREKDGKAIEKAMITPAAKTSIDTVHWVTKILIIFLVCYA
jgi:hypothetical protein